MLDINTLNEKGEFVQFLRNIKGVIKQNSYLT